MKRGSRTSLESLTSNRKKTSSSLKLEVAEMPAVGVEEVPVEPSPTSSGTHSHNSRFQRYKQQFMILVNDPRFKFMVLTLVVVLLLNADQNLLAPSLTVVAAEFNFTAQEKDLYLGGYLNLSFFVCGGIAALVAGYLADTSNRRLTFTLVVLIGEFSCFCTLFVYEYWGLFITRMFTGMAIGGSLPILYSLIGDSFVDTWRGRIVSLLATMAGLGLIIGQGIAGAIAPIYGWRAPFVAVSVPAMLLTLIFGYFAKEPARGDGERVLKEINSTTSATIAVNDHSEILGPYSEKMTRKKFLLLMRNKTVVLLLLTSVPTNLPWGFLIVYAQDYLVYDVGPQVEGGISTDQSYLIIILFAFSSGIGIIIGGIIADLLWSRYLRLVPLLAALFVLSGAAPMFVIINASLTNITGYYLLAIPAGLLSGLGSTPRSSIILNVTLPETRGTCFALHTICDDLGKGLGSFVIALLVIAMGGRLPAFNLAVGGWIIAGLMFFITVFTIKGDLDRNTEELLKIKEKMMQSSKTTSLNTTMLTTPTDPDETQTDRIFPEDGTSVV